MLTTRTPLSQIGQNRPTYDAQSSPHMPSSPLNPYTKGYRTPSMNASTSQAQNQSRRASYKAKKPLFPALLSPEPTQKALLRDRLKAKCVERAKKDRTKTVKRRAEGSASNSNVFASSSDYDGSSDMEMDQDDGDDDDDEDDLVSWNILNTPHHVLTPIPPQLFHRVVMADRRRQQHRAAYSFQEEVGSSYDPSIEEEAEWEKQQALHNGEISIALPVDSFA